MSSSLQAALELQAQEAAKIQKFEKELTGLINRHSLEGASNTPDWILSAYLVQCLKTFNQVSKARSNHNHPPTPPAPNECTYRS